MLKKGANAKDQLLIVKYHKEGASVREIGKLLGIDTGYVNNFIPKEDPEDPEEPENKAAFD